MRNVSSRCIIFFTWWCHQMETFSALLTICAGNSPVPGEFPARWWFETPSRPLWHHSNELPQFDMMTSSNGNIFRVTGPLCGEFTGPGEFPTQRPVTRSFDVYFDLRLNKRLCKQSWGWWFETLLCPLWRHSNEQWGGVEVIYWGHDKG